MDPKTKQLVEYVEKYYTTDSDIDRPSEDSFLALCFAVREQDERISELEQDAESCAEYEADALQRIGEEVIAGRQHEARGELPYWIDQIHEHYKRKLTEQDKRARRAEAERDTFDKRITELEIERDGLNLETEAKAKMIADLVAKLEAISSNGNVVPTNESFVRVAMVEHHGKSEMRQEYVQEWARRFGPALDIIRARVAFKVKELEAKLADAIELAAEAIPYASDYFREKYEFESRLAKLSGTNTSLLPK